MKSLYASIIVTVFGSLFFIGWGLDKLVADHTVSEDSKEIVFYKQLIEGLSQQLNLLPAEDIPQEAEKFRRFFQMDLSLKNADNIALPRTLSSKLSQNGGLLLASESGAYLLKSIDGYPQQILQLNLPPEPIQNQKLDLFLTLALYVGVCGVLILWSLPLTRRIYLLNSAAAKFGKGDLQVRVPKSRFSYITMLENSFNRMASQIETLIADNKMLASSLSHDIRTPMACLRFGVDAALDTTNVEKKDIYLNRMDNELTRMEDMTAAFLEFAGMERHGMHLKITPVEVNALLNSIIEDSQSLAEQHNIRLSARLPQQDIYCRLDFHWCYRAIQNLVGNAFQYAASEVLLTLTQKDHRIIITVEDDGVGIPEDKLETIFSPFVKLEQNRSREQGHFGLGLAISAKVMDWHEGKIFAGKSPTLSGACFTLSLPEKSH
ncbi:two-component sensor histidine kinase [Thalassomonas viridans]|uniref:histidine kinase n=1 Tax=Thalassomonas viridans TaxID=137584 RepID=A0AAF0CA68_9GAMM|nr:ATP-binding protein [Thalassomonas viridans]WDE05985.1 two-component sensor histidine kinase [Thalassomonas viridans]